MARPHPTVPTSAEINAKRTLIHLSITAPPEHAAITLHRLGRCFSTIDSQPPTTDEATGHVNINVQAML